MPNKISGYTANEPLAPVKGSVGNSQSVDKSQTETPATAAAPAADQLTLTASARSLQKIGEAIAAAPVVDSAQVAAVKQSVQSGTYRIDSARVATKILSYESDLG